MANPLQTSQAIAETIAQDLGGFDVEDSAWLRRVLRCFPVPTVKEVPCLIESFDRLIKLFPWSGDLLPPEEFLGPLQRLVPRVRLLNSAKPEIYGLDLDLKRSFRGAFLLTGTLLQFDADFAMPRGIEALRLVFLVCRWRWAGPDDPRDLVIDDLGSAIRSDGHAGIDGELLFRMGRAKTLTGFIDAASEIGRAEHNTTLAAAWRDFIKPELEGAEHRRRRREHRPEADGPPMARPGLPVPRPPPSELGDESDDDEAIDRIQRSIRGGVLPWPDGASKPLPGELPEEGTPAVVTAPACGGVPVSEDDEAVERYRIQQAIWSRNNLLLPNHPDVMVLSEYVEAVQGITAILEDSALGEGLKYGACALLVVALTGRTAKTLTALEVVADGLVWHDPIRLDLLKKEGAFRLSPFWQIGTADFAPSYFRPTEDQAIYLESVGDQILLPLVPRLIELFRACESLLRKLSVTPITTTEAWMRAAARHVARARGLRFTVGQLRASVATHLFEQCRDMAAVQLICADTLGQSVAPLSYCAPSIKTLAEIYWSLQNQLFGTDEPMPGAPLGDARVGARLLVRIDHAVAMARSPARILHRGVKQLVEEGRSHDIHMAMVNQLTGMLIAIATHRPTEALFDLTVADFWIDGDIGAAVFRDKVHDAAHDPRLVALPSTLCLQLKAYLEHLIGLGERNPGLESHVARVLKGKSPLLFEISEQTPTRLDLEAWKAGMPEEWQVLPMNWGRHWTRTHATEFGIRPELAAIQLGHLEIASYPFSGASPAEPWLFVETVAIGWEALAQKQGWKVVRGIPCTQHLEPATLTSLHRWQSVIHEHSEVQREARQRWRDELKSKLRSYREAAQQKALENPELMAAGIVARYLDKRTGLEKHSLKRADFERIRDELYEDAGNELALAIAQANALCHIAEVVNRRTRQLPETPARIYTFRRPVDNAFVPGMMEAVRQIHALREHVRLLADQAPENGWADTSYACACAMLAMVLFGYCESPEQIRGALERRSQLQRSACLEDVVLVPWGEAAHEVIALRGIAATAFSRLAWKFRTQPIPEWKAVEERLLALLPSWSLNARSRNSGDLLALLCETAAVANRYELSPAARMANAQRGGSTPAHLREQLAFIDGDPIGTVRRIWEREEHSPNDPGSPTTSAVRKGNARSQYLKLCAVFPSADKDTVLPLTAVEIRSKDAAAPSNRPKLVAEIEAQMRADKPESRLQLIVKALAGWTIDMLVSGTPRKAEPAFSTVETYLTRIGGALVHAFGQSSMMDVNEAELEDAYLEAIESKGSGQDTAAAAVLVFHAYAQAHFGFPEMDLSSVKLHLGDSSDALADARLVLPNERDAIIARLSALAMRPSDGMERSRVRVARQSAEAMPLLAFGGVRRSEALGIQFRDVSQQDGTLRVRIRPNSSRRLKTVNARRVIEIPAGHSRLNDISLSDWVKIERDRLPARRVETAFVFAERDERSDTSARTEIAEMCMQACRDVTGRPDSRLHAFRHLVVAERLTPVFLSDTDLAALSSHLSLTPFPTLPNALALPRDIRARVIMIGHGDSSTSLTWYYHLPWLLRSRSDARIASTYQNRAVLAPLLGVTLHALDWAVKQHPGRPKGLAWLDVQLSRREVPASPSPAVSETSPHTMGAAAPVQLRGAWTAQTLGSLLNDVARVGSLEKTLLVHGLEVRDAPLIRLGFHAMEGRLGRRMLEEHGASAGGDRPRRVIRTIRSGRQFEGLWKWYDTDEDSLREPVRHVAEALYEYLQPQQQDRICLPSYDCERLRKLLRRFEISPATMEPRQPESSELEVIRIPRIGGPNKSGNQSVDRFLGLALKRALLVVRFLEHHRGDR